MNRLSFTLCWIISLFLTSTSFSQNGGLVGLWKGADISNDVGYVNFDSSGFAFFVIDNDTLGGESFLEGRAYMKYVTDYSESPKGIDFVIYNKYNDAELGRMPAIFKFDKNGNMVLCINFREQKRPTEFFEDRTSILERVEESFPIEEETNETTAIHKIRETSVESFSLPENSYEIGYIKDSLLIFYDIETSRNILFPETEPIFNFGFSDDKTTLYYTIIRNNSLVLKRAEFETSKTIISEVLDFEMKVSDFLLWTTGEKSGLLVVGDTLSLTYGINGEHYSWGGSLYYVVNQSSAHQVSGSIGIRNKYYPQKNNTDQELNLISNLKTNDLNSRTDLFITDKDKEIKLSDFDFISEKYDGTIDMTTLEGMVSSYLKRSVKLSPDASKLIFNYPLVFYDLVHGPTCIVNLDGSNLKILINDGCSSSESKPVWLPDGSNILFIEHGDNGKQNLYMTINRENDLKIIDTEVNYFKLRFP